MLHKLHSIGLSALALGLTFTACQDDWDSHYDQAADTQYGDASIYEIICQHPELSDFREVVDAARLFANNRITATRYSEFLGGDQFMTVWAPVNGTFNKDSLLQMCQTAHGDSLVELHFLKNHIARYSHSDIGKSERFRVLNTKTLAFNGKTYGDATITKSNIASRNGILHIIDRPATYRYNIYEALFSLSQYNHVGDFLQSYQIDEFDETNSLAMGVVDGKTVYVDSVFYSYNKLMWYYGYIDREDSTYWMMVPDKTLWDSLYAEASTYYQYGTTLKADSIHDFWTNYALLQDLVYNPIRQRSIQDSLCSTTWSSYWGGRYHVYYNPFATDGLMSHVSDSLVCSNGTLYELRDWPFLKEKTYFTEIKTQAEGRIYAYDESVKGKTLKMEYRGAASDSVSGGYVCFTPATLYDPYYFTYEVRDVLSGTYDVCIVLLPKTVYNPNYSPTTDKKQFRPNKFSAEVSYVGLDGLEYTVNSTTRYKIDEESPSYYVKADSKDTSAPFLFDCNFNSTTAATRAFTNDPYLVDTIRLATIHFPTCNYDQTKVTTRIKITNNITNKQTNTYNSEMFVDCFLFLPHIEK